MATEWLTLAEVSPQNLTPMLRQYLDAKAQCGDSLLFFRMGDFYELFFEDAVEAAELIGLTLTSRDGADKQKRIPMAGVPVRAVDGYLAKVIQAGRTVTICDQMEDPKFAKGIVKRAVTRTVTPGTIMEPALLDEGRNNYLGALCTNGKTAGLAFVDVTTGEFLAAQIKGDLPRVLMDEFVRMSPAEIVVCDSGDKDLIDSLRTRFDSVAFTKRSEDQFDTRLAKAALLERFQLHTLKGLGLENAPEATAAAGAVLAYVQETQRDATPHLQYPRRYDPAGYVVLDGHTQRNLELVASLADGRKRGTLLGVLDRTRTPMGGRLLRQWLLHPLLEPAAIHARLNAVEELVTNGAARAALSEQLRGVADLARLLGRITAKSANAREVSALGASLARLPGLCTGLTQLAAPLLGELCAELDPLEDAADWIARELADEPPLTLSEGGLIRDGFNAEVDRMRELVKGGRTWIATLQREESQRTGIPNLKVGYNKVFGYFLEVSKAHVHKAPPDYERKQTLVNAERYITPTLKSREEEIINAQERLEKLEYELFVALRERLAGEAQRIQRTADAIAAIDVLVSFAEVAANKNYCKPMIAEAGAIRIRDGRHPVVEDLMTRSDFVPNDTLLDPALAGLVIVTGPNMAGKSTYLRQVALITLMAQIGSFVPAAEAEIGVVDRIFTRVGASDNLVRGESTFMVEMIETANILNAATARSLIVLDEIGRGTSTYDGISIAWSVAEHIHDKLGAKTLFATHYHELTALANKLDRAKNISVAVREYGGRVVFLYRIVEGGADHSYGIQVAKLAGLPVRVIARARQILEALEAGDTGALGLPQQLQLFAPATRAEKPETPNPLEAALAAIDPDALSPRDAHEWIYRLKGMLER